jgi:hypothetical protein
MKRILIASILGLSALIFTAYGQAQPVAILFDNYSTYNPIYYSPTPVIWTTDASRAPAGRAGSLVTGADGIFANLLWTFGAVTGDAHLAVPVGNLEPGYFHGPVITILGYDGTISPITLTVQAWAGGSYATATARGALTWTRMDMNPILPGPGPGPYPNTYYLDMPGPLVVEIIPEPSVLAIAALAFAAARIGRRRI